MSAGSFLSVPAVTVRRLAHSRKARMLLAAVLLFDAAAIFGVVRMLAPRIGDWQGSGLLDRNLWLLCLVSWGGTAALSMLAALQEGFGQKAILTFTLPVPNPARLRILYGSVVYQLLNLWVIAGCGFGIAVVSTIGVRGLAWLVLQLTGHAFAVLFALLLLFAAIRWLLPRSAQALWIAGVVLAAVAFGAFALVRNVPAPWPLAVAGALVVLLVVALGPLAGAFGDLYARAFYVIQASSPRAVKRRWMTVITAWLLRSRAPGAALFVKDLLTRSRHWANWGRVIMAVAAIAAFPLLRAQLRGRGFDDAMIIAGFVLGGILLTIVDGVSSPFGSEGNRLTLLLTAPVSLPRVLRAKFTSFVVPFSITAAATTAGLALAIGLGGESALRLAVAVVLMLIGISALFVLGSVFDVDLDLEVEGGLQGLMQEEAPLTPVRLVLTAFGTLLLAVELFVLSRVPYTVACAAFLLVDAILITTGFQAALTRFRKRILRG
ncbi:MAG TPA: hypothetical protein VEO54_21170 [Thermoanaerobaculia bacterium]|nr:hypothetical protein [Thermoanaerobaculia bacterium]